MLLQIEKLPVFFKHRNNLFYPTWAAVLPTSILRLPYSLLEATLWTVLTYFEVGLSLNAGRCADVPHFAVGLSLNAGRCADVPHSEVGLFLKHWQMC